MAVSSELWLKYPKHSGEERGRVVEQSPPVGELARMVGENAIHNWQTRINCEGLLGTHGRVFCQKELQLRPPKELRQCPG